MESTWCSPLDSTNQVNEGFVPRVFVPPAHEGGFVASIAEKFQRIKISFKN